MDNNGEIQVFGHTFVPYLSAEDISAAVKRVAGEIERDYAGREPLFLVVLTGAFVFAADLFREVKMPATIRFVRLASYEAMASTGEVREIMGLDTDVTGKDIIVVEDIVDSGTTMHYFLSDLKAKGAASAEVCSLLFKPEALKFSEAEPRYAGFRIPRDFVIGYGLDYDGYVRNLPAIYTLKK